MTPEGFDQNELAERCNLKFRDGVLSGTIETGESIIIHDTSKSDDFGGFLGTENLDSDRAKELFDKYRSIAKEV